MAHCLDSRCVLISGPSTVGAWAKTRLESSIKKFTPHLRYHSSFFQANNPDVSAILLMMMPGDEAGHAMTDLVWGATNPSGKLPITLPHRDNEQNMTQSQWPGVVEGGVTRSTYSEKLLIGYRWYDYHGVAPLYEFGFGLSYTTFVYSDLEVDGRAVHLQVRNAGERSGSETVQLYLGFPSPAGEPPKQRKGFYKVRDLAAGATQQVSFNLTDRALSTWSVATHSWIIARGAFSVLVGASSRDIRLNGTLAI